MTTVGILAAGAGAGLAWWRLQPTAVQNTAVDTLWSASLSTPEGQPLLMSRYRGKPLLINFWATWCPPCVEEMPLIDAFFRQNAANGWQVVGIAADKASAVKEFAQRHRIAFDLAIAGTQGVELSRQMGNASGALPFSVIINTQGEIATRKMGKLQATDLDAWKSIR